MFKSISYIIISVVVLCSCSASSDKSVIMDQQEGMVKQHKKEVIQPGKMMIGSLEKVRILPADIIYDSRIDTGATTTSLHAENIEIFERDGKKWVKFDFKGENKTKTVEMKIKKFKNIKQHGAPNQKRIVVSIILVLGDISQKIDVTLNDRSKFKYPGLIGRNFMKDIMIVDVSKTYTVQPVVKQNGAE